MVAAVAESDGRLDAGEQKRRSTWDLFFEHAYKANLSGTRRTLRALGAEGVAAASAVMSRVNQHPELLVTREALLREIVGLVQPLATCAACAEDSLTLLHANTSLSPRQAFRRTPPRFRDSGAGVARLASARVMLRPAIAACAPPPRVFSHTQRTPTYISNLDNTGCARRATRHSPKPSRIGTRVRRESTDIAPSSALSPRITQLFFLHISPGGPTTAEAPVGPVPVKHFAVTQFWDLYLLYFPVPQHTLGN